MLIIASVEQLFESFFDHVLCLFSVIPDRNTLLEHLFDAALSFIMVIPSASWCRFALFVSTFHWTIVVHRTITMQLHSVLLILVVHLLIVLDQLTSWALLATTKSAIIFTFAWSAF